MIHQAYPEFKGSSKILGRPWLPAPYSASLTWLNCVTSWEYFCSNSDMYILRRETAHSVVFCIREPFTKRIVIIPGDYQSAFLYFSFDDPAKPHPVTSSDLDVSRYFFQWNAIHEPGRRRPVLKCNSGDCCCFQIPQPDVPCVRYFSSLFFLK